MNRKKLHSRPFRPHWLVASIVAAGSGFTVGSQPVAGHVQGAMLEVRLRTADDGSTISSGEIRLEYVGPGQTQTTRDAVVHLGQAVFEDVPFGGVTLESSAVGFAPGRWSGNLEPGKPNVVELRLAREVPLILVFATEDASVATLLEELNYTRADGSEWRVPRSRKTALVHDQPQECVVSFGSMPAGKLTLRLDAMQQSIVQDAETMYFNVPSLGEQVKRRLTIGNLPVGVDPAAVDLAVSASEARRVVRLAASWSPNGDRLEGELRALAGNYRLKVAIRNLPGRPPNRPVEAIVPFAIATDQREIRIDLP